MLFNSFSFLVFFPITVGIYYVLPDRYRPQWLLVASCYFYASFVPAYLLILFALIGIDYLVGLALGSTRDKKQRLFLLVVSICANLGMLFFFKYFNFFNENIMQLAQLIHWNYAPILLQIALPLGLSFHIFQSLSYVIEVYKGKQEPERNLGIYALYVMFFPQLVAGPIERPQHMLPQFHQPHAFDALKVRHGLELMLMGFFKKIVIADQLAPFVNHLFAPGATDNGAALLFAAVAFTYQLYCDFSGYSDIAVGIALVLGYDLTQNFHRPFAARSVAEFWRRWHISLSTWLRDYLYYPLTFAGKRITKGRLYSSLFITFVLIGLWHGANWTFAAMGGLFGLFLVLSSLTEKSRETMHSYLGLARVTALHHAWQVLYTFALVVAAFVFFRAESVGQAIHILWRILHAPFDASYLAHHWVQIVQVAGIGIGLKGVVLALVVLEIVQYFQEKLGRPFILDGASRLVRWAWYYLLLFSVLFFGYFGGATFIYFKF